MTISIKKAAIAAALSIATLGSIPATASATSIDFFFGTGGSGIHVHDGGRRHGGRWERDRGFCSERRAVRKARHRFGLRHAHVVRANHRKVVVKGRYHGRRERIVFANVRGCPVIRY